MPALAWLAFRGQGDVIRFRQYQIAITSVAMVFTSLSGYWLAGYAGLWITTLVFLFLPERTLLAPHLWPDVPLATIMAALSAILIMPDFSGQSLVIGLIAACAFLTRFDALVVAPITWLAWSNAQFEQLMQYAPPILLPTFAGLLLLTLFNGLRFGKWLPDDTAFFNLSVMNKELTAEGRKPTTHHVRATAKTWSQETALETLLKKAWAELFNAFKRPHKVITDIFNRLLGFCGQETFLTQKVLPAYPNAKKALISTCHGWLRWTFPLLLAMSISSPIVIGGLPTFIWPTFALFVAAILFHTRTRYRLAILPGLVLLTVAGWSQVWHASGMRIIVACLIGAVIFVGCSQLKSREEMPAKP
jgi:hypothetical protein